MIGLLGCESIGSVKILFFIFFCFICDGKIILDITSVSTLCTHKFILSIYTIYSSKMI